MGHLEAMLGPCWDNFNSDLRCFGLKTRVLPCGEQALNFEKLAYSETFKIHEAPPIHTHNLSRNMGLGTCQQKMAAQLQTRTLEIYSQSKDIGGANL